jgi:hypothetical protein
MYLKIQKCDQFNPKREQYEIYERSAILDWIFYRGEPVEQVARYALGVVRALEKGKVEEWKTTRRRRSERRHGVVHFQLPRAPHSHHPSMES